jgi:protein TonB
MHADRRENLNLLLFLLVSLLVHLLVLLIGRGVDWQPEPAPSQPVYIEMQAPTRDRELDLPVTPDQPRTTEAKRLGPSDQVVDKETAPIGDAPEDRLPAVSVPVPTETQPQPQPQPKPTQSPDAIDRPVPDLTTLMALPQTTQVRIGEEFRRKYRPDVATGDAVWLDTEKDYLISFFQRLRNGIYANWNYPPTAVANRQEGQYLIEMIFDRSGKVLDVYLVDGQILDHPLLVREAIAAVFKGGPYGALPKSFDQETLTVKAWFSYNLQRSGRPDIFGQR